MLYVSATNRKRCVPAGNQTVDSLVLVLLFLPSQLPTNLRKAVQQLHTNNELYRIKIINVKSHS